MITYTLINQKPPCVVIMKTNKENQTIFKIASRYRSNIPLQDALIYILQSDDNGSDLNSSVGGMSCREEEESLMNF